MNIATLPRVHKKVLANGLTVLVLEKHSIPKVSTQLWYNVGSKHEKSGERGLAHFLEHMIFKGTDTLSESDINLITHKLSGYTNAFTSYDYTGYLFDFPTQHWTMGLRLVSDSMRNCRFDQEHWNSEIKAVIQELKMYLDDYGSCLTESMITAMFNDHPYHYPIIGYKQDLWNLERERLINFYKKHYLPNNATLVVVGDIQAADVFAQAEAYFGSIEPNWDYQREHFFHIPRIGSTGITLYRDVTQPTVILTCLAPAAHEKIDYAVDIISWMLGSGTGSRLYNKLVNELNLVSDIDTFSYDTFDQGIFFIQFQPLDPADIERIITIIKEEVKDLAANYTDTELDRATNKAMMDYVGVFENNQKCAYALGKSFTATGDEDYLTNYIIQDREALKHAIDSIFQRFMHPNLFNIGKLLPLEETEKELTQAIQEACDTQDEAIVAAIPRTSAVEPGVVVHSIQALPEPTFAFPRYESITLANGLEVLYYHNPGIPKIDILLEMECKYLHDPVEQAGIGNIVSLMMREGTTNYSAQELAQVVEGYGMSLSTAAGTAAMKMLAEHFAKGLELLQEVLMRSTMKADAFEQVRKRVLSDIADFWDAPTQVAQQLAKNTLYADHPYHKNGLGSIETVQAITAQQVADYYHASVTPRGARIAIVGDLSGYNIEEMVNHYLGQWTGEAVQPLAYPALAPVHQELIKYPMMRDQIVLLYAGLSVKRSDSAFDKCLLFDQIFGGGTLGSMSSKLFELREQSGLFYTISGTLLANADTQTGMSLVKTIVSIDRLEEARKAIAHTINTAIETLTDEEVQAAQQAVINSLVDNFESNRSIAGTFLFLRKHNLPINFFDTRAAQLRTISKDDIIAAVKPILSTDRMIEIQVGRV